LGGHSRAGQLSCELHTSQGPWIVLGQMRTTHRSGQESEHSIQGSTESGQVNGHGSHVHSPQSNAVGLALMVMVDLGFWLVVLLLVA
jgi:hypothetical protein